MLSNSPRCHCISEVLEASKRRISAPLPPIFGFTIIGKAIAIAAGTISSSRINDAAARMRQDQACEERELPRFRRFERIRAYPIDDGTPIASRCARYCAVWKIARVCPRRYDEGLTDKPRDGTVTSARRDRSETIARRMRSYRVPRRSSAAKSGANHPGARIGCRWASSFHAPLGAGTLFFSISIKILHNSFSCTSYRWLVKRSILSEWAGRKLSERQHASCTVCRSTALGVH